MITGWGTSTRMFKIIVHYYSSEDGRPICKSSKMRTGRATIPKPNWDPAHHMTCPLCRQLCEMDKPVAKEAGKV